MYLSLGLVPATHATNLLVNPEFDSDTAAWTPHNNVGLSWSPIDVVGHPASGSAEVSNASPGPFMGRGIEQCAPGPVVAGRSYDYGGWVFAPSGQVVNGEFMVGLRWYDGPGCSGSAVGNQPRASTSQLGTWVELQEDGVIAPPGAQSLLFLAFPSKDDSGGALVAYFDELFVRETPLFADGFEGGGFDAWSGLLYGFVTTTPYDNPSDIELVTRVFCVDGGCPWGDGYHDGIDFVTATNLVPFFAACDGEVTMVDSFITGAGNRQVNVILELVDTPGYGLVYAFEPMTPDAAGQQEANIVVQEGDLLTAGQLIGNLVRAPAVGSHVHWGVVAEHQQVCPEPFLAPAVSMALLDLIHRDWPGWLICY
jgi:hypothetical protein